jgi:methionyl-tRNA formyltransferase
MHERPCFVVAGSRPWNRLDFETLAANAPARWIFVSNVQELDAVLDAETPRYVFFLHWNWRVPARIWRSVECVCFHMTDVPYGRGGSPLQNLILAGHRDTVVSALRMVDELDAGPVYTKRPLSLEGKAEDIYRRAGAVCVEIIRWMVVEQPEPLAQVGEIVQFSRRLPAQSLLPDTAELDRIYDHIRMLDAPGYPAAFIDHGPFRLDFSDAQRDEDAVFAKVVIRRRDKKD